MTSEIDYPSKLTYLSSWSPEACLAGSYSPGFASVAKSASSSPSSAVGSGRDS